MIVRVVFLSVLSFSLSAHADDPTPLTWGELAGMVQKLEPRTASFEAAEDLAEADEDQSEALKNPTLAYLGFGRTRGTDSAINGSQHQIELEQDLPLWGQRKYRRQAAASNREVVQNQNDIDRIMLLADARARFLTLLFAQERAIRIEAAGKAMAEQRSLIEGRVAAGFFSQHELIRAKLEESRLSSQLEGARADMVVAQGAIADLLLQPGFVVRAVAELTPPERKTAPSNEPTPSERAAEARVRTAEALVHAAERERYPEVALSVGAYLTTNPDSSSVLGGLRISLPSFDTGRPAVSRARAQQKEAESVRDIQVKGRAARLEAALREWDQRKLAYERYTSQIPPQIAALEDMVQAAYAGGRVSAFVLIDSTRDLLDAELEGLGLLEDLWRCDARVRTLSFAARYD